MFALVRWCAEPITQAANSRSRSQLKITSLSLEFHVHSISPEPFERYLLNLGQMFALVRWCAEPITQQCRFKVKVTIEGPPVWALNFEAAPLSFFGGGYSCLSDCLVFVVVGGALRLIFCLFFWEQNRTEFYYENQHCCYPFKVSDLIRWQYIDKSVTFIVIITYKVCSVSFHCKIVFFLWRNQKKKTFSG